jgi:hypothetical protein
MGAFCQNEEGRRQKEEENKEDEDEESFPALLRDSSFSSSFSLLSSVFPGAAMMST